MGQVYKIDARIKKGEVTTFSDVVRDLTGLVLFRRIVCTVIPLLVVAFGCWAVSQFISRGHIESSAETIATSVNATRRLFQSKSDVGEGSIMVSLVLSHQYDAHKVSVKWSEGGLLDVKNGYGGKLDVVALRNHFELHFNGVPHDICRQLVMLYAYEKTGMPVWVNTLPISAPSTPDAAQAACSAQVNNLVWKFR